MRDKYGEDPEALKKKPVIDYAANFYLNIFHLLWRGKPLAITDILAAGDVLGCEDAEKSVMIIKQLEAAALVYQNKQMEKQMKAGSAKGKAPKKRHR